MQIKVQNRKLLNLGKICSKFFFLALFSIIFIFEAKNTCFLLIPVKFVAVLRKMKFLKNPRWRICCEIGCCHGNSSLLKLDFCYGK